MSMMELEKKKYRSDEREAMVTARDLFGGLPIDLIQTILSFLINLKKEKRIHSSWRFEDTKEAAKTIILSKRFLHAWSTFPDVYLSHLAFNKHPNCWPANSKQIHEILSHLAFNKHPNRWPANSKQIQELSMEREKFANYVLHTLTKYQQHNIPIRRLHLTARLQDCLSHILPISIRSPVESDNDRIANILEQSIHIASENGVKEFYLRMVRISHSNLLQTIFALKQLVSLYLYKGDLVKKDVQDCDIFINCSSLRRLKLEEVGVNEALLQKLIHSCPLIERIHIISCHLIETIQVANLPNLKKLKVITCKNQIFDVKAASLERMTYGQDNSPYVLNIESAKNLKILRLKHANLTDAHFHNLITKCPVLEELTLDNCDGIQKINISSHSLSFLGIIRCQELMEVKIDAPILNMFEYVGGVETDLPLLSFANGGFEKRKSIVSLDSPHPLVEESSFLQLSKFLMAFKHSDTISLTFCMMEEISFDSNIMDGMRDQNSIPEFDEVYIKMDEEYMAVSSPSIYSTIMEGLLWSFSPKIISVKRDSKDDEKFIMYLCEELLVQHDDHPNISTSPSSQCWRNYFKQAKFEDRDDEWRPLHSWKSLEDVLENLRASYILKLSHD